MAQLSVHDLSLMLRLGCSAEERENPQEVRISLDLAFPEAPRATSTDAVEDTVCYFRVCEKLQSALVPKTYNTIEFLAARVLEEVKSVVSHSTRVRVRIHKMNPPVPSLLGGTSFTLEDP